MATSYVVNAGTNPSLDTGSKQENLASNSSGHLFALIRGPSSVNDLDLYVSTDDGATWTKRADVATNAIHYGSGIFVSADDSVFVVYTTTAYDPTTVMYEWNGTDTLTQKASYTEFYAAAIYAGGISAQKIGTDWYVHYVLDFYTVGYYFVCIKITSAYATSRTQLTTLTTETAATFTNVNTDLVHTGDGKTPDGTYDVWVSYRRPTSVNFYFHLFTYSAGTWTKGTQRSVSMNTTTSPGHYRIGTAAFDGSDYVIASMETGSSTADQVQIWYRDGADTTTTTSTVSPAVSSASFQNKCEIIVGNNSDIVYVVTYNNSDGDLHYIDYTKSTDTWGTWASFDVGTSMRETTLSVRRHAARGTVNALDCLIYNSTGGSANWYFAEIESLNTPPTVTITAPTDGTNQLVDDPLLLTWTYNDPESDTQSWYSIRRVADAATTEYWNGSGWVSTESGSTQISGTATSVEFSQGWGDPSSTTVYSFSVKANDGTDTGDWSTAVDVYPTTNISTNRGFALPRPYKKQENLTATLKSNTDYMLSWINNYVPSYGDLNDDLYTKAGIRTGGASEIRDAFPPVVGEFDIGNATNYFNALGATNVYRTNEIALSEKKTKDIYGDMLMIPRDLFREPKVKAFRYKEEKRNAGKQMRFGLVAEDLMRALADMGINPYDSSLIYQDENKNLYIVENQLIYLLWHAVQQLQLEVEELLKDKNK